MQDDFNSAPTPAALPTPQPAPQPYRASRSPQAPQPGQFDPTKPYYGSPDVNQATVADPGRTAAAWPNTTQGPGSPYAPTVRQPQPSGPPVYTPPGYAPPPSAPPPPRLPAPLVSPAPLAPPSPPVPPRSSGLPGPPRQSHPAGPPRRPRRWAAWIPLPHVLLAIGVALLYIATLLPWAVDQNGALIMLQGVSIQALSAQGGDSSALQTAYNLVGAVGVLSAGLLVFNLILNGLNRALGRGCLAGCVVVPLYPILLALILALVAAQVAAAGFGGLGALGQIPVVQSYGLGGIGAAHYEPGYYVWYTGLIVNVAGMLGEFAVWRR